MVKLYNAYYCVPMITLDLFYIFYRLFGIILYKSPVKVDVLYNIKCVYIKKGCM